MKKDKVKKTELVNTYQFYLNGVKVIIQATNQEQARVKLNLLAKKQHGK